MKIKSLLLLAVMTFVIAVTSCSKKRSDYVQYVPADAAYVMSLNVQSLLDKSGALDNQRLHDAMVESASQELSGRSLDMVKALIDDPAESGVELGSDIYFWMDDMRSETGGIVIGLKDKSKFMSMLDAATEGGDKLTFTEQDGCDVASADEVAVAVGEGFALMRVGSDAGQAMESLKASLSADGESCFASTAAFREMSALKGDFGFMYSMKAILAEGGYQPELEEMLKQIPIDEVDVIAGLTFDKGKVEMDCAYCSDSKEWEEWVKKSSATVDKVSGKMMDYVGEDALGAMFFSTHGKEVMALLSQFPGYSEMFDQLGLPFDLKQLLSTIDGQVAIGVNSFSILPEVVLCAEVTSDDIMRTVNAQIGGTKVAEGKYAASVEMVPVYYGMEDGMFYASLSQSSREGVKKADPSFSDNPHAATAKGSYGYIGINVKSLMMLPQMEALRGEMPSQAFVMLQSIDYVELYGYELIKGKLVIHTNSEDNTLRMVTELIASNL